MTSNLRLVVSPHLDDAVFSCPGWMLAGRRADADVRALTLFSHARGNASEAELELYARRRREDELALEVLGATPIHAGLSDAPFRSPAYRSFEGIVCGPIAPGDGAPSEVFGYLEDVISRLRPKAIHALLAVGDHVDHRIVFEAARRLEARHPSIEFTYGEDRPYCLVAGATAVRLGALGFRALELPYPPGPRGFAAELMRAAYVRAHVTNAIRERVVTHAETQWRQGSGPHARGVAQPVAIPWSTRDAELFLQAMQRYETQFDTFFGSADDAKAWLGLSASTRLPPSGEERLWRLELTPPDA